MSHEDLTRIRATIKTYEETLEHIQLLKLSSREETEILSSVRSVIALLKGAEQREINSK